MRKAAVVGLLVLALSIPATPALASNTGDIKVPPVSKGSDTKPTTKPTKPAKPAKPAKPVKVRFVAAGELVSADAGAGTLTLRVRGGKDKTLRGQQLTITVPATSTVRRNGVVADLADLVTGDRVNVSGVRTGSAYAAGRVAVQGLVTPDPAESTEPTEGTEPAEPTDPAETDAPLA